MWFTTFRQGGSVFSSVCLSAGLFKKRCEMWWTVVERATHEPIKCCLQIWIMWRICGLFFPFVDIVRLGTSSADICTRRVPLWSSCVVGALSEVSTPFWHSREDASPCSHWSFLTWLQKKEINMKYESFQYCLGPQNKSISHGRQQSNGDSAWWS